MDTGEEGVDGWENAMGGFVEVDRDRFKSVFQMDQDHGPGSADIISRHRDRSTCRGVEKVDIDLGASHERG